MRRRRRTVRLKAVIAVMVLAGLGGGGWALARSRVFALSRVDVAGIAIPSMRHEVVRASGLTPGQGALGVDLRAVEQRVEALPWVASATARRHGSLAVLITVVPRAAAALVESGDREFFVDASGHPVAIAPTAPVPRIEMPDARALAHAGTSADACVHTAISFWRAVPEARRSEIRSITPRSCVSITFHLGRIPVTFGEVADVAQKFAAIDLVLARAAEEGRRVRSLDVSVPEHPAARLTR